QSSGGFCYKGDSIPIFFREHSCRIQTMTCSSCEPAMYIHLTEVLRCHVHTIVRIKLKHTVFGHIRLVEVTLGKPEECSVSIICRGDEYIEFFGKAETPGVVAGAGEKLKLAAIRRKTVNTVAELHVLSAYLAFEARIAHDTPDLVVKSISKVGCLGVGVAL